MSGADKKQRAAIVLVIDDQQGQRKVLAVTNRKHGGWGLPGGGEEAEDADLKETASRELSEETGLQVSRRHLVLLGRGDWAGREVSVFYAAAAGGEPRQVEDGTVPRWRVFDLVMHDSPFRRYYAELFPDGVDHLKPTQRLGAWRIE